MKNLWIPLAILGVATAGTGYYFYQKSHNPESRLRDLISKINARLQPNERKIEVSDAMLSGFRQLSKQDQETLVAYMNRLVEMIDNIPASKQLPPITATVLAFAEQYRLVGT